MSTQAFVVEARISTMTKCTETINVTIVKEVLTLEDPNTVRNLEDLNVKWAVDAETMVMIMESKIPEIK